MGDHEVVPGEGGAEWLNRFGLCFMIVAFKLINPAKYLSIRRFYKNIGRSLWLLFYLQITHLFLIAIERRRYEMQYMKGFAWHWSNEIK